MLLGCLSCMFLFFLLALFLSQPDEDNHPYELDPDRPEKEEEGIEHSYLWIYILLIYLLGTCCSVVIFGCYWKKCTKRCKE